VTKITAAFISSLILVLFLPTILPVLMEASYFENVLIYVLYGVPTIFTYGILASILADSLSRKLNVQFEKILSLLFHFLFGMAFVIPYGIYFDRSVFTEGILNFPSIVGSISSIIFFIVNGWLFQLKKYLHEKVH
jgi:hypothetical protein